MTDMFFFWKCRKLRAKKAKNPPVTNRGSFLFHMSEPRIIFNLDLLKTPVRLFSGHDIVVICPMVENCGTLIRSDPDP